MGVVLLIVVLLTVGCSSDEDLNGPVPVVTAQLNFSLPTRIAGVHHATRMTGDIVQEKPLGGTENDVFRGLDGVQMLCFDEYPTESSYKLGNMIDIKADEAYDSVATEDDYSLCQQIEIPVGTSYFGFYASATEELSTEDKEKYKTQHEKRMHFGAIETVGLSKSSYQGNSNIRFKPLQICTSTDPLGGSDIGKDLLQLLNDLMEIIDPAGNLYLNEAYQRLTEFSTLSSYNVQTMLGFILKLVNQEAPDNQGSQSVSAVTAKITSCCAKDETQQPIFDIDKGTIKLKDEYMGFPADLHLPDGAARIRWNKAQGKFEVPDKQEYGNDLDVTSVNDYVYPMSLQYQVFSDILASDDMVILTTNSEGEVVPPDDPQYKTWDDLIKKGYIDNNADNEVQSTTQSVAMVKQVQYAVGRLALKARLGNDTYLKDANGKSVYVGNNPFTLKGYVIGNQRDVDYDFQPVATSRTYAIYDTDLNGGPQVLKRHYFADADYILGLGTAAEQSILVALELVNNGEESFQGSDGIIVPGATFYLVANMNPQEGENHSDSLNKIFFKDHATQVFITINSLANATYGLPNLDIPRPTVGMSVDLRWGEGLWFDDVEL